MMIINGNHESAEGAEQGPKITQIKEQCGEVKTWLLASELGPGCASLPRSSSLNKTLAGILMQKKKNSDSVCQGGGASSAPVTGWAGPCRSLEPKLSALKRVTIPWKNV